MTTLEHDTFHHVRHFLVEVLVDDEDRGAVLDGPDQSGRWLVFIEGYGNHRLHGSELMPTGQRYSLSGKNPHPCFLDSADCYDRAPKGTIAADDNRYPMVKLRSGSWQAIPPQEGAEHMFPFFPRRVLRWGWWGR